MFFSFIVSTFLTFRKRRFKVLQTWVNTYNNENPFDKPYIVKYLILDIKKNYIKYMEIRDDGIETVKSCKKDWFAVGAKLQK